MVEPRAIMRPPGPGIRGRGRLCREIRDDGRRPRSRWIVRRLSAVAATLIVGVGSGCATKSDVRELESQLMDALRRQEEMIAALQRITEATRDSVAANSEGLFDLQGNTNRQLLDIQDQLITLQELAGQSQRNLAAMRDQLERQRQSSVVVAPSVGDMPGGTDEVDQASQLFNAGVTAYERGSLGTARRAFQQFLDSYASHDRAPDAQYYLADILVQENSLDEAVAAFQRIPELYPSAERVPWAIYRVGLLQLDRGNTQEAVADFERVVNTYPDSDVAGLAQSKLDELR